MHNNIHNARIFFQFLVRDSYIYSKQFFAYFINYSLIYPVLYSFTIGYLQSQLYFGNNPIASTVLFVGHILINLFVLANNMTMNLIFDLESYRFIDYQITLLPPRLILLERILFASLFTFTMAAPFFPIAKILLGDQLVTAQTSWLLVYSMLYMSALACSAYHQFTICIMPSSRQLRSFWTRYNFILITLGGIFIPWHIIMKFSPILGILILFNPLIYITEGLRSAFLDSPDFIPVWLCLLVLTGFTVLFTLLAWHFFKKRVDHI